MRISEAIRLLPRAGIHAVPAGPHVLLTDDGPTIRVAAGSRSPTPGDFRRQLDKLAPGERVLFAANRVSPALATLALRDPRVIVVTQDRVILDGREHFHVDPAPARPTLRKGPRPYGMLAVARALLSSDEPQLQVRLAELAGVTQPSVSNALRRLADAGLVTRSDDGWMPVDRARLFDLAASEYPGPGGITTYWWHDARLAEQAALVRKATSEALLSGDLAASEINGWRVPEVAVVYLRAGVDPAKLGFASSEPGKHTLEVTIPADTTLWATAAAYGRPGIADPVIVFCDIQRTGTTGDQAEAAARVKDTVVAASTITRGDE